MIKTIVKWILYIKAAGYVMEAAGLKQSGQSKEIDVLARTIYGEARGEGMQGMQAVANVVMNRAKIPAGGAVTLSAFAKALSVFLLELERSELLQNQHGDKRK